MRYLQTRHRAGALLLGLGVLAFLVAQAAPSANGQTKSGDKEKRFVYQVKHGSARELAQALAKFFHNEAVIQPVVEGGANALLINAAPSVADEVMATLALLDRKPQSVVVDVWILEVVPKKDKDGSL